MLSSIATDQDDNSHIWYLITPSFQLGVVPVVGNHFSGRREFAAGLLPPPLDLPIRPTIQARYRDKGYLKPPIDPALDSQRSDVSSACPHV